MLLSPGTTLGRYRIVDALRSGGMATLYLGRRTGAAGFTKPVAIKVVHEQFANDKRFIEMFVEEAKLAARVEDPHVAHTEELGHEQGVYFIAMEYVLGGSLAQILATLRKQARALSPTLAVRVTADAARGLHAVHDATSESGAPLGIVHRDVSPQNILVSTKGVVKVIDLGVAKVKDARRTETGSLTGKLAYMAPEQARGEPLDRRTDVYALAIVLWEMLTSRRLFRGANDYELLKSVQSPTIEPPSRASPHPISPALEAVVMRALRADPRDRPATADQFCEELLAAEPDARRVTTSELGSLVERTLGDKLAKERKLLSSGNEEPAPLPSANVVEDVIATRTIELPEGSVDTDETVEEDAPSPPHETIAAHAVPHTAAAPSKSDRWPLVVAGLIAAAGVVIAIVFLGPAPPPTVTAPAPASVSPLPAISTSPAPETVVEIFEPPPQPTTSAMPAPMTSGPARSKKRGHAAAPHPAGPIGSTSIVHGTPLTTDVK